MYLWIFVPDDSDNLDQGIYFTEDKTEATREALFEHARHDLGSNYFVSPIVVEIPADAASNMEHAGVYKHHAYVG